MNNKVLGNMGEEIACKFLIKKGYKILERGYKNSIGEIDIICSQKNCLVFVEVKFRSTIKYGFPREAITGHKLSKIKLVATSYIKSKSYVGLSRIDCIEILGDEINHIQNVSG